MADRVPSYEQGGAMADQLRTINLELAAELDEDDWGYDPQDYDTDEDFEEQRRLENEEWLVRDHTHEQRSLSIGFQGLSWDRIEAVKYKFLAGRREAGDKRPEDNIVVGFYNRVYPQFGPYIESRLKANPDASVGNVTQDFLDGADLRAQQATPAQAPQK